MPESLHLSTNDTRSVVFYDGDCGFCNSSVQFILRKRKRDFYFMPLQSEKAKPALASLGRNIDMDTIYYLNDGKLYERSSAALRICRGLRGLYPLLFGFIALPKFLRDPIYNFIAKRRHRVRRGYCVIPDERDRKYFIA